MAKFDYSEYRLDDYEKYRRFLRNTNDLLYDNCQCKVSFTDNNRTIKIYVDQTFAKIYEHDFREELDEYGISIHDYKAVKEFRQKIEEQVRFENDEEFDESEDEELIKLKNKFSIRFRYDSGDVEDSVYDHKMLANALSGSCVTYSLGEGLLDFCDLDITKHLDKIMFASVFINDSSTDYMYSKIYGEERESKPIKFKNWDDEYEYIENRWKVTNEIGKSFFYCSLYTAVFTPTFLGQNDKSIDRYLNYLSLLKNEFSEKLQFCFDEDFFPSILGHLHPVERYNFYCTVYKDFPTSYERTEKFDLVNRIAENGVMPYSFDKTKFLERLNTKFDCESEEYKEFVSKYCHKDIDQLTLNFPKCVDVAYSCSTIHEILNLEFTKMLEAEVKFRKCKRCGKYFIMKGNYDTKYCDRAQDGQTRTCQEIAAQENYKAKTAGNPALPIYSKYYKRYAARVRSRQIKEPDFKKWKFQALTKRDECSDGKITPEEYITWMEDYFPNRKPKNK